MKEKVLYTVFGVYFIVSVVGYIVQQSVNDNFRNKIEVLQEKIDKLESANNKMLSLLENDGMDKIQQVMSKFKSAEIENWRRLKEGMTEEQVRLTLGEPTKIHTSTNSKIFEYDLNGDVGYVHFGNNQKVERWDEPLFRN